MRTVVIALAGLVVVGGALVHLGYKFGMDASKAAQERMSVLWPSVFELSVDDRTIVMKAALACNVYRLPADAPAAEVAACLREGAHEVDKRRDDEQGRVLGRLEELLQAAEGAARKAPVPASGVSA